MSQSHISKRLSLLQLPQGAQDALQNQFINIVSALQLASLEPEHRSKVWEAVEAAGGDPATALDDQLARAMRQSGAKPVATPASKNGGTKSATPQARNTRPPVPEEIAQKWRQVAETIATSAPTQDEAVQAMAAALIQGVNADASRQLAFEWAGQRVNPGQPSAQEWVITACSSLTPAATRIEVAWAVAIAGEQLAAEQEPWTQRSKGHLERLMAAGSELGDWEADWLPHLKDPQAKSDSTGIAEEEL